LRYSRPNDNQKIGSVSRMALDKPFGIEMLHPRDFLRRINR
jgi:hypothetical protein